MAGERIPLNLGPGGTGKAIELIVRNKLGQVWNGSIFAAYSAGNENAGAIDNEPEQGTSGFYEFVIPPGIPSDDDYSLSFRDAVSFDLLGMGGFGDSRVRITDASFGWDAADAAGIPATVLGKLRRWINEWFLPKKRNRTTNVETAYAADGTTPLHKRTLTNAVVVGETIDTVTPAAP